MVVNLIKNIKEAERDAEELIMKNRRCRKGGDMKNLFTFCITIISIIVSVIITKTVFGQGENWVQATSSAQWTGRYGHTSVVFDNKIWVLGGCNGSDTFNDVWYSTDGITWVQATSNAPWPRRAGHTSVVFDNKMWIMGGWIVWETLYNDVWYSSDGVNWTQATASAQWSPRVSCTSVVFDDKIWVMGGSNGEDTFNDVWYSTDGITWVQATSSAEWARRMSYTSVVFDEKMWVMGGWGVPNTFYNDVWHSTDGTLWTQATYNAQWSGRDSHSSIIFADRMWVIGGTLEDHIFQNDVWYSTDGVMWGQATSSAQWAVRVKHTSVVFDNKMWVIGGYDGSNFRNDVWYSEVEGVSEKNMETKVENHEIRANVLWSVKGEIVLSFYLTEDAFVELSIFDITGRFVDEIKKRMSKGEQRMIWMRENNTPGVYFFKLKAESQEQTREVLLKGVSL